MLVRKLRKTELFTGSELITSCMISTAEDICLEMDSLKKISVFLYKQGVKNTGITIQDQLNNKAQKFQKCSPSLSFD